MDGVLEGARGCPSPNYNERPRDAVVDLLVIHNISLPPGQFGTGCVEAFFQNQLDANAHPYFAEIAHLQVSAHLLILRTGEVVQFVNLNQRAWHAGQSCFAGREQCNDFSIGIELEGTDTEPYTFQQYQVLAQVTGALQQAYPAISAERITGHEHIAPNRKTDPGPAFNWAYYRQLIKAADR